MLVLLVSLLWAPVVPAVFISTNAAAPPPEVVVNRFGTVRSADGYINLRVTPSTEHAPERRIENGTRLLVLTCDAPRRGRRWCRIRTDLGSAGMREGFVYDAELDYAPPAPVTGAAEAENGTTGYGTAAGAGIAEGVRVVGDEAIVRSSDGFLNLRAGPSSSREVLHRLPDDSLLWVYGCRRGAKGARWCFVEALDETLFGYVYDRELVYFEHEDHEH